MLAVMSQQIWRLDTTSRCLYKFSKTQFIMSTIIPLHVKNSAPKDQSRAIDDLAAELMANIEGEVRFDDGARALRHRRLQLSPDADWRGGAQIEK